MNSCCNVQIGRELSDINTTNFYNFSKQNEVLMAQRERRRDREERRRQRDIVVRTSSLPSTSRTLSHGWIGCVIAHAWTTERYYTNA